MKVHDLRILLIYNSILVKQLETNVDDVKFCKTTRHMKYHMKPVSATLGFAPQFRTKVAWVRI